MARTSTKQKRQARNRRKGIAILSVSLLALGVGSAGYVYLKQSRIQLDAETLCPKTGPTSITAILIDSTDPLAAVQKDYVQKYFDEFSESIPDGAMVSMYSTSAYSEQQFGPTARLCNPGDGSGASELTANPQRLRQRWQEMFREPFRNMVETDIERGSASQSPLLEMLKALSVDAFPLKDRASPLQLIIVSDMLANTSQYSHYTNHVSFESLRDQPYFVHLFPNLRDVDVRVLYVGREGLEEIQTRQHAEFWAAYFEFVGASLKSIKRI
jgi:hypothetical protein